MSLQSILRSTNPVEPEYKDILGNGRKPKERPLRILFDKKQKRYYILFKKKKIWLKGNNKKEIQNRVIKKYGKTSVKVKPELMKKKMALKKWGRSFARLRAYRDNKGKKRQFDEAAEKDIAAKLAKAQSELQDTHNVLETLRKIKQKEQEERTRIDKENEEKKEKEIKQIEPPPFEDEVIQNIVVPAPRPIKAPKKKKDDREEKMYEADDAYVNKLVDLFNNVPKPKKNVRGENYEPMLADHKETAETMRARVNQDRENTIRELSMIFYDAGYSADEALDRVKKSGFNHDDQIERVFRENLIGNGPKPSGGKGLPALWSDQIETYFKDEDKFTGVYARDELDDIPFQIPQGFIMNMSKSNEEGTHWVAIYITDDSLEYFDPLADPMPKDVRNKLKDILDDWKLPILLKFKVNKIKQQNDSTDTCGFHAIRFLQDRFDNLPFPLSTRYDDKKDNSEYGENVIREEFKLI